MNQEEESTFDAIVRKTGHSCVITIPKETITKLSLGTNSGLSVVIRKWKNG